MPLRQLSIQWKITLLAGLCLAVSSPCWSAFRCTAWTTVPDLVKASSMQMLTEAAQSRIESQGEVQALNIRRQFMDAYQYGAGFARQVLFLREQAKSAFSMPSTCART
jgi:methyl-accepting chemotaxis protein